MNSFERYIYLTSIGWKDGDKELTNEEIENGYNAAQADKAAARQAVLDKLGLTQDEVVALLG